MRDHNLINQDVELYPSSYACSISSRPLSLFSHQKFY